MFLGFVSYAFRNLEQGVFLPHPQQNLFFGENGQGKTNVIEALYVCATLRSFRTNHLEETVAFDQTAAVLQARVCCQGVDHQLDVALHREKPFRKEFQIDGRVGKPTEDLGLVRIVLFVPEDLHLFKGPPANRRQYLDRTIWNADPIYLKEVQLYNRVLRQRNAALRAQKQDILSLFDEQLALFGAKIIFRRKGFTDIWSQGFAQSFERISSRQHVVSLQYRTSCQSDTVALLEQELLSLLRQRHKKDLARGSTSVGPHVDDLECCIDHLPARLHASQGQTRALLLASKMAEIQHLQQKIGVSPVLLLDDVSSELDVFYRKKLFDFIWQVGCQTFITTTDTNDIPRASEGNSYRLKSGQIEKIPV